MKYCEDCGNRVYNGHCTWCHKETYIYEQNIGNDELSPMSDEFMDKVRTQRKQAKEITDEENLTKRPLRIEDVVF